MGGRDKGNTFLIGGAFREAKNEIRRRRKNRNWKALLRLSATDGQARVGKNSFPPTPKEDGGPKITHYFLMKPVEGDFDGRSHEDKNKYDKIEWVEIEKAKKLLKKFKEFEDEKNAVEVAEKIIKKEYL